MFPGCKDILFLESSVGDGFVASTRKHNESEHGREIFAFVMGRLSILGVVERTREIHLGHPLRRFRSLKTRSL